MDVTKFYFNKSQHTAMGNEINELAASKNVTVSRWVNNSKGRQIITYKIHTGERNQFGSKQENVLFETQEDAGRGRKVYDETEMLKAVLDYLNSMVIEEETVSVEFVNIEERYGDAVTVKIADYLDLNPDGEFTQDEDGIYESGVQIAERVNA